MTYEGLLTVPEAAACERSGYSAGWLVYREVDPGEWAWGFFECAAHVDPRSLFAPMPGEWLPMTAARRNGDEILLLSEYGKITRVSARGWDNDGAWWGPGDPEDGWPDALFLGWQPLVIAKGRG